MKQQLEALVRRMYEGGILYEEAVREFKKAFITTVVHEQKGNLSKAAAALHLHRNTLTRAAGLLGIDVSALRPIGRRPPTGIRPSYVPKAGSR